MSLSISDDTDTTGEVKIETTDSTHNTDRVGQSSSSPLSSPPSSPPVLKEPSSPTMSKSPSRKRSHEEMRAESEDKKDSSMTVVDEADRAASQGKSSAKDQEPSSANMSSVKAHSMLPPALPTSTRTAASAQKPNHSREGSHKAESQAGKPEKGDQSSTEKLNAGSSYQTGVSDDEESLVSHVSGEANDEIENFDWIDLQERYHDKVKELATEQHNIMAEFDSLCNYFGMWAQAGSERDTDRSFKRLKTQMTLVQHHENELEQKRLHYIKVVDAFKSALKLLAA